MPKSSNISSSPDPLDCLPTPNRSPHKNFRLRLLELDTDFSDDKTLQRVLQDISPNRSNSHSLSSPANHDIFITTQKSPPKKRRTTTNENPKRGRSRTSKSKSIVTETRKRSGTPKKRARSKEPEISLLVENVLGEFHDQENSRQATYSIADDEESTFAEQPLEIDEHIHSDDNILPVLPYRRRQTPQYEEYQVPVPLSSSPTKSLPSSPESTRKDIVLTELSSTPSFTSSNVGRSRYEHVSPLKSRTNERSRERRISIAPIQFWQGLPETPRPRTEIILGTRSHSGQGSKRKPKDLRIKKMVRRERSGSESASTSPRSPNVKTLQYQQMLSGPASPPYKFLRHATPRLDESQPVLPPAKITNIYPSLSQYKSSDMGGMTPLRNWASEIAEDAFRFGEPSEELFSERIFLTPEAEDDIPAQQRPSAFVCERIQNLDFTENDQVDRNRIDGRELKDDVITKFLENVIGTHKSQESGKEELARATFRSKENVVQEGLLEAPLSGDVPFMAGDQRDTKTREKENKVVSPSSSPLPQLYSPPQHKFPLDQNTDAQDGNPLSSLSNLHISTAIDLKGEDNVIDICSINSEAAHRAARVLLGSNGYEKILPTCGMFRRGYGLDERYGQEEGSENKEMDDTTEGESVRSNSSPLTSRPTYSNQSRPNKTLQWSKLYWKRLEKCLTRTDDNVPVAVDLFIDRFGLGEQTREEIRLRCEALLISRRRQFLKEGRLRWRVNKGK